MPVLQEDLHDAKHSRPVDMEARCEQYKGMSSKDVYTLMCRQHACKVNSGVAAKLNTTTDDFDTEVLDMSDNMAGSKGVIPLMEVARLSRTLKKVILENNYLDNNSIRCVTIALKDHPSVETIDVCSNPISWTAGMHLYDLVQHNPSVLRVGMDKTFLKKNIKSLIEVQCQKNQAMKARKKITGANPTNHPLAIRLRALKRLFLEFVSREGAGEKIPKRLSIEGYKENMRMQSRELELEEHSVAFYQELQRRCNADSMGLIDWEAFLVVSMVDDTAFRSEEIERIKKVFHEFDSDKNGYIDLAELRTMITDITGDTPSDSFVQERMSLFDATGTNTLTVDEFIVMMVDKGPQIGSTILVPDFPSAQPRIPHF